MGLATSLVQQLMGRRCRTLLPVSESSLRTSYPLRDDVCAMSDKKRSETNYYDRHAKPLPNVSPGEIVPINETSWSKGLDTSYLS